MRTPARPTRSLPPLHAKEIFEQPKAIADTLDAVNSISPELFGDGASASSRNIDSVLILACGTSYYSGLTAKYWLESIAKIPTSVEIGERVPLPRQRAQPAHPGRHHQPKAVRRPTHWPHSSTRDRSA